MKKLFLSFSMLFLPMIAVAEVIEIDGVYYNLLSKTKTAEVTSNPNMYSGEVVIPETVEYKGETYDVTSIGNSAFSNCWSLTSIEIPNSMTSIGSYAFDSCSGLISITIPNSVTSIGSYAFERCSGLISVTIPNSVTQIGEFAFCRCNSLTSITIPNSVTGIGRDAFSFCRSLTSVTLPNSITFISTDIFAYCSSLTSVTIPISVTVIGDAAFYGCSSLTSVTIPNEVRDIRDGAFCGCSSLTSVTIPNSVTQIGQDAFEGCSSLISVTIGSGVYSIYSKAFASCKELTDVYCHAENVPSTKADIFEDSYIEYATLHVPESSINDYKAAEPWKNFKSIVALDGNTPETQKCATPVIIYENGKLMFACATEGVEYVTDITCADIKKHYSSAIDLTGTYIVSVYATKAGYDNSDVATKEIQISGSGEGSGKRGDLNNDGEVNAADAVTLVNIIMNNQ